MAPPVSGSEARPPGQGGGQGEAEATHWVVRLAQVLDQSGTGLAVLQDLRLVLANQTVLGLIGCSAEDLPSIDPFSLVETGSRESLMQRHQRRLGGEMVPPRMEVRVKVPDGRVHWLDCTALRITWQGRPATLNLFSDITDYKRTQSELALSREKYAQLFAASPTWMALTTLAEGRFLEVNHAFERVTGWSANEVIGRSSFDLKMWVDPAQRTPAMDIVGRQGGFDEYPVRFRLKEGRTGEFLWSTRSLLVEGEECLLSAVTEVTRARQAARALAESEERFRTIVNNAAQGIVVSAEGLYRYVNPRLAQMLGFRQEELVGQPLGTGIHPEDRPLVAHRYRQRLAGESPPSVYTVRGLTRQGHLLWLQLHVMAITWEDNPASLTLVSDVTMLKQIEEDLRRERDRTRKYLETAGVMLLGLDREGRVEMINRAGLEILGCQEEEVLGQTWFDLRLPPSIREKSRQHFARVMAGEVAPARRVERGLLTRGGQERLIKWHNEVFRDEEGRILGTISSGEDITELKQAEQARAQLEAQLRQSQKLEAIGTLAGGIAHDFNNVLGAIIGFTELARMGLPPGNPAKEDLREVLQAAKRARSLVKQILSFTRQTEQELAPLKMDSIVKEELKMLRATLPSTIEMRSQLDGGQGVVMADATQMHQMIMNLCANAASAMQEKGGLLEVALESMELSQLEAAALPGLRPGPHLRLMVRDDGSGMTPQVRDRVFEPFFTTKKQGEGTGLGLSVVHGIVRSHGGAVTVESQPGKGSTFQVWLPLVPPSGESSPPDRGGSLPTGSESILFVDDEISLVELARRSLGRLGYRMHCFSSSPEALESFMADPKAFDLVISDQTMPRLTGSDLARLILRERPEMPIILCTGHSNQVDPERARDLGVRSLLMKPLDLRETALAIRQVLDA